MMLESGNLLAEDVGMFREAGGLSGVRVCDPHIGRRGIAPSLHRMADAGSAAEPQRYTGTRAS